MADAAGSPSRTAPLGARGRKAERCARGRGEGGAAGARRGAGPRARRGEWEGRGGLVTAAPCPEHPEASRRLESAFYAPLCPHRCYNVSMSSVSRDVIGSWKYVMGARLFVFVFLSLSCLGFLASKESANSPRGLLGFIMGGLAFCSQARDRWTCARARARGLSGLVCLIGGDLPVSTQGLWQPLWCGRSAWGSP